MTTTPDPVRTAVLSAGLDAAPAATLARLHARFVGFQGRRPELARRLELTDSALRTHLDALESARLAVRERFNVDGRWAYVIAVTDTPGILPTRDELRDAFRNGVHHWTAPTPAPPADHHPSCIVQAAPVPVPRTPARSGITQPASTCLDASSPQVGPGSRNSDVNRFPTSSPAAKQHGGTDEPVNRLNPLVPESGEVRAQASAHAAANRSVIGSVAELEALARMRGARPVDGGKFRTSREILAASRRLDQDVVEAGLALLAEVQLPFWVAPEVWALLDRGWTPDRVALELDGVHTAKSAHSVARYRLARALEAPTGEPDSDEPTRVPASGGDTPPGEEVVRGVDVVDLVERDSNHVPSWSDQATSWEEATGAVPDDADNHPDAAPWDRPRRKFGWRAPATPDVPSFSDRAQEFAAIRAASGGAVITESHQRAKLAEIRATLIARKSGTGAK